MRRSHGVAQDILQAGALRLDPSARQVTWQEAVVPLSTREFDLLHALMRSAGRVLSREQLEQQMYSWGLEVESNTIEVHVSRLRKKLGHEVIETERGLGYRLGQP